MLIRFAAKNFRSVREPVELSMVAIDRDREEARPVPLLGESILPVAAIYGPNASGKSNILAALAWLRNAVQNSLRFWEDGIPVEPFAFADHTSPSEFTIELVVDGVRFEYALELNEDRVIYEGLFHYPEKKRRRIFEREENELKIQRGLGMISGTRELLTGRALALSIARRFEEPLVSDFAQQLLRLGTANGRLGSPGRRIRRALMSATTVLLLEKTRDKMPLFPEIGDHEQILALLRLADPGIEDVLIDGEITSYPERLRLLHKTGDESMPLDFTKESEGTVTWFNLIGSVLTALRYGAAILIDELDASLHPTLSAELLRIFHSPVTNPRGAQLIFTSHDTSLLNHLNRDEVWLTEKLGDGSTRLGALSDFAGERVRRSQNLESAYLHGRFGALPQVDQTELLRALGLIG